MKILSESNVFENKLPQLKSRQSLFPYLAQDEKGKLKEMWFGDGKKQPRG